MNDRPTQEEAIFEQAVKCASESERAALLDEACGDSTELRARLELLLEGYFKADGFLAGEPQAHANSAEEAVGRTIGRYKLLENIGEGGCGVVYVAEQAEPVRRRVALKVIKLGMDTRAVVARFEAERQALALMDHPNIAKVLDAGSTETGRPYFVMELVRGIKITDYCDQNNLPARERLKLFIQVCHAIQHAHQKGIIHRDIKPSNILVTLQDGVPVPKVIDFGIAKATEARLTEATVYTQLHQLIGTPAYMSPEQAEMTSVDVDTRSDIYSLGVLLYELLTGRTPFDTRELMSEGIDTLRRTIRETEPVRPSTRLTALKDQELTITAKRRSAEPPKLISMLKGDLDCVVMKCLEKDRARRYDTANGLAMDIERHLNNEALVARPPSKFYRFQKLVQRNKPAFAATGAVVFALVIGTGISVWQSVEKTRAYRHAKSAEDEARAAASKSEETVLVLTDLILDRPHLSATSRDPKVLQEALGKAAEFLSNEGVSGPESTKKLLNLSLAYEAAGDQGAGDAIFARAQASTGQTPSDLAALFAARCDFRARRGRWTEAVADALKLVAAQPSAHENYSILAPLLVATGDLEGYRRCVLEILRRFSGIQNSVLAERMVKASLILPPSGVDMRTVAIMADVAVNGRRDWQGQPYSEFAKGLAEYRQGRFGDALEWLRKSIDNPLYGEGQSRFVQAYMVLAMAEHRLHHFDAARAALAKGTEIKESKLPKVEDGDLGSGWYWRDWIVAEALAREARETLENPPREP